MRTKASIIVGSLLISVSFLGLAMAPGALGAHDWEVETLDSDPSTDFMPSIVLSPTGHPMICYASEFGLNYTHKVGSTWQTEVIEGTPCAYPSIALDRYGDPHVSYIDANEHVKYATKPGAAWNIETVDAAHSFVHYTDIAVDEYDHPHVVYQDHSNDQLRYARRAISSWNTGVIDVEASTHRSVITVDGANTVHAAYFDESHNDLQYASKAYGATSWSIQQVLDYTNMEAELDIAVDSSGNAHIIAGLSHLWWEDDDWQTETLSGPGTGDVEWASIAVDENGNPHVLLRQSNGLVYGAHNGTAWNMEFVDSSGNAGNYCALTVDEDGHPHVTHFDDGAHELLYAVGTPFPASDTDGDDLPDAWELEYFGNLDQGPDDDHDSDDFDNQAEYEAGTDPTDDTDPGPTTDGDNLPDSWEMTHFGNLDQLPTGDPDGDGYTNYAEYVGSSDPNDPNDFPQEEEEEGGGGWWIWLVLIAIIVVIIIFVLLMLRPRGPGAPPQEPLQQQQPQVSPVCPTCGQPGTFVPEYNMYYCHNCQSYIQPDSTETSSTTWETPGA